jgi:hypothetical protein
MSRSSVVAPPVHSVHFYGKHEALILRLRGIVAAGLERGNCVLIIASQEHRRQLTQALERAGVHVRSAEKGGSLMMFDAAETLSSFMVDGRPNSRRFFDCIGQLLEEIKQYFNGEDRELTVFGEMVALLWQQGNKSGALELESLWNDLLSERAFHLHCAYPNWNLANEEDSAAFDAICKSHSHVIGTVPLLA